MSKSPGLKPYATIQTGPTSDAYRDGWERTFGSRDPAGWYRCPVCGGKSASGRAEDCPQQWTQQNEKCANSKCEDGLPDSSVP